MTKLATAGTFSCATISISGFKGGNKQANIEFNKGKEVVSLPESRSELDVYDFYENILHPVKQELGETKEYAFQELINEIDEHNMGGKMTFAVLTSSILMDGYWQPELEKNGFTLVDTTDNDIGGKNVLFIRNNNRRTDSPLYVNEED